MIHQNKHSFIYTPLGHSHTTDSEDARWAQRDAAPFVPETEARSGDLSPVLRPRRLYRDSTTPRNRNRVNRNHLVICLMSSQKNRSSLTSVLVASGLTVCFAYPVLCRVSAQSRAGEWEL